MIIYLFVIISTSTNNFYYYTMLATKNKSQIQFSFNSLLFIGIIIPSMKFKHFKFFLHKKNVFVFILFYLVELFHNELEIFFVSKYRCDFFWFICGSHFLIILIVQCIHFDMVVTLVYIVVVFIDLIILYKVGTVNIFFTV